MTDEERVNNVIRLLGEIGQSAFAAEREAENLRHVVGDYTAAAYVQGRVHGYRDVCKLIHKALQPDYLDDAV